MGKKLEVMMKKKEEISSKIKEEKKKEREKEEKQSYAFLKKTKLPKIIYKNIEKLKNNNEVIEIINEAAQKIELNIQKTVNETV